ncbi:MAG: carbohydrate kinase family protein [Planctomycetes bacterium]|nr:carbohydrate kinase family protein [Planctomycetota bacterium]
MVHKAAQIIVAGHIGLDIIPSLEGVTGGLQAVMAPGKLIRVGAPVVATGGIVANTGLALHKLGVNVGLIGKIGDDVFGRAVLEVLKSQGEGLTENIVVAAGETTAYSIVINVPGADRFFLHWAGANDTFVADDIDYDKLPNAKLLHFGYPPLMRQIFVNDGRELESLLRRAKERQMTTSLDMAHVDPASEAGQVDWPALLRRVLPYVDLFEPSVDEIIFMLDRPRYERMQRPGGAGELIRQVNGTLLAEVADAILSLGVAVVMLKLGDQGVYLRTTSDDGRLDAAWRCAPTDRRAWAARELLMPCFQVKVAGTTGAGDSTIGGFLAAVLRGDGPEQAMISAVATGACSVEALDASSGVRPWPQIQARIAAGWKRSPVRIALDGWRCDDDRGVFFGPNDITAKNA